MAIPAKLQHYFGEAQANGLLTIVILSTADEQITVEFAQIDRYPALKKQSVARLVVLRHAVGVQPHSDGAEVSPSRIEPEGHTSTIQHVHQGCC